MKLSHCLLDDAVTAIKLSQSIHNPRHFAEPEAIPAEPNAADAEIEITERFHAGRWFPVTALDTIVRRPTSVSLREQSGTALTARDPVGVT